MTLGVCIVFIIALLVTAWFFYNEGKNRSNPEVAMRKAFETALELEQLQSAPENKNKTEAELVIQAATLSEVKYATFKRIYTAKADAEGQN